MLVQPNTATFWGQDWGLAQCSMVNSPASVLEATANVLLTGLRTRDVSPGQNLHAAQHWKDKGVLLSRSPFAEACTEHQEAAAFTACSITCNSDGKGEREGKADVRRIRC